MRTLAYLAEVDNLHFGGSGGIEPLALICTADTPWLT